MTMLMEMIKSDILIDALQILRVHYTNFITTSCSYNYTWCGLLDEAVWEPETMESWKWRA